MAKAKTTAFFCKECGYESAKWMGQCPGCRQWNTFVEELVGKTDSASGKRKPLGEKIKPAKLSEISIEEKDRVRNFQPPITGEIIMQTYDLEPCSLVGEIKAEIKEAILDGVIPNDYDAAFALMEKIAAEKGLVKQ